MDYIRLTNKSKVSWSQSYFGSGIGIWLVACCFRWCHTNILGRIPNVASILTTIIISMHDANSQLQAMSG